MSKKKEKPVLQRHIIGKNTVLFDAAIEAGFTPEQIGGFDSEESLKEALRRIKPGLIAGMESGHKEASKKPLPQSRPDGLVDKLLTFSVEIPVIQTKTANHAAMEEMQIQSIVRAKFIKNIRCVSIVRSMEPDKRNMMISQVTVNYRG